MYLSTLKHRNFIGVDACLETSLFEYGFIYKEVKQGEWKGEFIIYYLVRYDEEGTPLFDNCVVDANSVIEDCEAWWNEKEYLASMVQMPEGIIGVYDLITYYGYENILGEAYDCEYVGKR